MNPLLLLITTTFLLIRPNTSCNTTCGNNHVQYPFGFSPTCKIPLNCSHSNQMLISDFPIKTITSHTIRAILQPNCTRSLSTLLHLFSPNFAPTSRNAVLLYDCESTPRKCRIPSTDVQTQFESLCEAKRGNVSCYSDGEKEYLSYESVRRQKCRHLMSSIAAGEYGDGASLDVQVVELGWWLDGDCRCSRDANCTVVISPDGKSGFRCACRDGFSGDGFSDGSGCSAGLFSLL